MRVTKTKMFTEVKRSVVYLVEGQGGSEWIAHGIFVFLLYMGDLEIYLFFSFGFFQILFNKSFISLKKSQKASIAANDQN